MLKENEIYVVDEAKLVEALSGADPVSDVRQGKQVVKRRIEEAQEPLALAVVRIERVGRSVARKPAFDCDFGGVDDDGDAVDGGGMSESKANLYAAIVAAQSAVQPVGKGSVNTHHKYAYASGDDVIAEARRALNEAGLAVFSLSSAISEHPYQWEDDKGAAHDDIQLRINIQFRIVHTSGESHDFEPFSVPVLPERGRPLDKAEAGARTYALSYFLRELLLIPRVDEQARGGERAPDQRDDRSYEPRRQTRAAGAAEVKKALDTIVAQLPQAAERAERIASSDASAAYKVARLRELYREAVAANREQAPPAAPRKSANPEQVAHAQRLVEAARLGTEAEQAQLTALLAEYSRGSGQVGDIDAADLPAFISEAEGVLNGAVAA